MIERFSLCFSVLALIAVGIQEIRSKRRLNPNSEAVNKRSDISQEVNPIDWDLISESEDNKVVHNSDLITEISENLRAVPLDSNPLIPKESNESYEVEEEDDKYSHLSQEVNPIDWDLTSGDSRLEDSKVNQLWVRTEVVVEENSNLSQEVNPIDWDLISESDDNEVRASPMPRVFNYYCHLSDEVNPIDWDMFSESEEKSDLIPQTSEKQRAVPISDTLVPKESDLSCEVLDELSHLSREENPIDWDLVSDSEDNETEDSKFSRVSDDYSHLSQEMNPIEIWSLIQRRTVSVKPMKI